MGSRILTAAVVVALAAFYVIAATEHARRVNTSMVRGDQSGYMWDAQNVYANWHEPNPPILIGERNRMPVYAGFLALFWTPGLSNEQFFEHAKRWNIYLSLGLIAALIPVFFHYLPPLPAVNLTLIVSFGYFVFKAGYVQCELLFYFLFFIAFVAYLELFACRPSAGLWWRAAAAGAAAALAHLTKASVLPFVAIVLITFAVDALVNRQRHHRGAVHRLVAAALMIATFLAVLSPYLQTNKRVFGRYFYNVNTTFYMWYEDWPQASIGTIKHGDGVGWPKLPRKQLPSASRYWQEHTMREILVRIGGGFWNMVERSYQTYSYFKYLTLYLAVATAVMLKQWSATKDAARSNPAMLTWLALYAVVYLVGIAFYAPVSDTGTSRFLIAHLLPLFFVLSRMLSREPFRNTEWILAGATVRLQHVHLAVCAMLAFDIAFLIWPRLMTTYGGF